MCEKQDTDSMHRLDWVLHYRLYISEDRYSHDVAQFMRILRLVQYDYSKWPLKRLPSSLSVSVKFEKFYAYYIYIVKSWIHTPKKINAFPQIPSKPVWFYHKVMHQKYADGLASNVNPVRTDEPRHEKTCFMPVWTTKVQIVLCLC